MTIVALYNLYGVLYISFVLTLSNVHFAKFILNG
jgi:hypothetical protein